jgi:glycosyltransferase involved in cell wall biosynthesis
LEQHSFESPLNILFISSWYPNSEQPTLGNFVQKHAQAAAKFNRISVISVVSSTRYRESTLEKRNEGNVEEYIAYYPKSRGPFSKAINLLRNRKAFLSAFKRYLAEHGSPSVIHLNVCYPLGIWALLLKKKYGIPYVVTEHSSGFHIGTDHAYPAHVLNMSKKVLKGAELILPVSRDLENSLKKLAPNGTFEIVSNVVDETIFQANTSAILINKQLIHISTGVDAIKNLSGIIRAIDLLSSHRQDFIINIVSDGEIEYAKNLAATIKHPELIQFHATKSTQEIAEMLQASDALVLFSNYENFPCVIPEAFMSGKPVISTAVNGIPEHVDKTNGILIECGNEQELATAIEKILDKVVFYDPLSIRQYALDNFSYSSVGHKLDQIYRRVIITHKSGNVN